MVPLQVRRLTPLVVLFALVQAMAPAFAAIADAWRLDRRTPYAHIESETEAGCVVVHAHDCALCSVATSPGGEVRSTWVWYAARVKSPAIAAIFRRPHAETHSSARQRAPPGIRA